MQYQDILKSWLRYLELEKLYNLKIKAEKLSDYKRATLGGRVQIEDNKLTIFIPKRLKETLNKNAQIYLGFPVIEEKRNKNKRYFLPLFIIKKNIGKEQDRIEIDTEVFTDFLVAKPILLRALDFEPEEIEELIQEKPLLSLLKDLLSSWRIKVSDNDTFKKIYLKFKKTLKGKFDEDIDKDRHKLASFDAVVTTEEEKDFEFIETSRVESVLKDLVAGKFPEPDKNSAAFKYIFGEQTVSFEDYNKSESIPWFGSFHDFELSEGQALLLQKKAKGENLIAVQGPPGTGKTTVLMAVIASTIVERALSIARGMGDFPSLILVASTANKAVENAAREFKLPNGDKGKEEVFKNFEGVPLYAEGKGFYFIGGKNDNISESLKTVNEFKKWLEGRSFSADEYEKARQELLSLYSSLDRTAEVLKSLFKKVEEVRKLKQTLDKVRVELDAILKRSAVLSNLNGIELKNLQEKINRAKNWVESFRSIGADFEKLSLLADDNLRESVSELKQYLQRRNMIDKIVDFFLKREKRKIKKFLSKNQKLFDKLGIAFELNAKKALSCLEEIENLHLEAKRLLKEKPDNIYLENLSDIEHIVKLRQEKLKLTEDLKSKKSQIKQILAENELGLQLNVDEIIDGKSSFLKIWKSLPINKLNKNLFILSAKFLYLEALKQKKEVLDSLEAFRLLMSSKEEGGDIPRAKRMIEGEELSGVKNFYRYLSLVYPVHFSSLHSAPYIFTKLKDLLGKYGFYKPIHILYIDEAAMALPHLSFPSIYFSEKVIAVGDPLQLEPVVPIPEKELKSFHETFYKNDIELIHRYSPARTSTYHRAARCKTGDYKDFGEACFLDEHRRCQKPIAELFKAVAGYERLKIETPPLKGNNLERLNKISGGKHLIFIHVSGKGTTVSLERNTNPIEVKKIKEIIQELISKGGYSKEEIIVITPFVKQEKLLKKKLTEILSYERIGTIHKFQGQEALVAVMSTVVQEGDSTSFIDAKPNLLNVAISRAKHLFIMVGNKKRLRRTTYFSKVLDFVDGEIQQRKQMDSQSHPYNEPSP